MDLYKVYKGYKETQNVCRQIIIIIIEDCGWLMVDGSRAVTYPKG
jgi:hypothetical protein